MSRVLVDPNLSRRTIEGFAFPLGVYPVGPVKPKAGYVLEFEPADEADSFLSGSGNWSGGWGSSSGGAGGWSEDTAEEGEEPAGDELWPDRFLFDILVPATRVRALWRAAATLLPPRVFPILDVLGNDAYREIDPYIAFEMVGLERLYDGVRWFEDWLFEDGLVGFGAMALDPFVYLFLDEHKILTIRVPIEMKDRVEKMLAAMDLEEVDEIVGPDAAEHEHMGVLVPAKEDNDALSVEEIIERLRDQWMLQLNVDPATNLDDNERPLGLTAWRCVVRCFREEEGVPPRYADVLLVAGSLDEAEQIAVDAATAADQPDPEADSGGEPTGTGGAEITLVAQDRITPEELVRLMEGHPGDTTLDTPGLRLLEWLDLPPASEGDEATARPRPHPQGEPRTGTGPQAAAGNEKAAPSDEVQGGAEDETQSDPGSPEQAEGESEGQEPGVEGEPQ